MAACSARSPRSSSRARAGSAATRSRCPRASRWRGRCCELRADRPVRVSAGAGACGARATWCGASRRARCTPVDALLLAAIVAGALGRAHAGGHDNVRLPAFALLCIAGTCRCCRALCSPERSRARARSRGRARAAVRDAVAGAELPRAAARQRGAVRGACARARALRAAAARSVALDYAALGDQPFMHTMALSDLRLSGDRALSRAGTAALLDALRSPSAPRALAVGEHFAALDRVLGERYRECARVPAPALATGYQPGLARARPARAGRVRARFGPHAATVNMLSRQRHAAKPPHSCSRPTASAPCCAATRGCFPARSSSCAATPQSGETVLVRAADGAALGWAAYSPSSQIRARMWDFDRSAPIDDAFFLRRVRAARDAARGAAARRLRAYRLVHAESDGLPGLVVDRYGDQLVLQATSAGAALHRERSSRARLCEVTGLSAVYERSEGDVLQLEGIAAQRGALLGAEPDPALVIEERGVRYGVDAGAGHKTGFYLDQRDNRALVRELAQRTRRARLLLLQRRLQLERGARRRALGVRASTARKTRSRRLRRNARLNGLPDSAIDVRARGRVRVAAQGARQPPQLRSDRARSAQARAERAPRRARRARVQGSQPARVQVAAARRRAAHVLVFGRRVASSCSRRSWRRRRPTPRSMPRSCGAWARASITRSRWRSPKASTSRACCAAWRECGVQHARDCGAHSPRSPSADIVLRNFAGGTRHDDSSLDDAAVGRSLRVALARCSLLLALAYPLAARAQQSGGSSEIEMGALHPSQVEMNAGRARRRAPAQRKRRHAHRSARRGSTRSTCWLCPTPDIEDFDAPGVGRHLLVPIVTPGVRLIDGKLFAGLGFGFGGRSNDNGPELELAQRLLAQPARQLRPAERSARGALARRLAQLRAPRRDRGLQPRAAACNQNNDATGWGASLGAGVRGFLSRGPRARRRVRLGLPRYLARQRAPTRSCTASSATSSWKPRSACSASMACDGTV